MTGMEVKSLELPKYEHIPYILLAVSLFGLFFFQMTSTVLVSLYSGLNFFKDAISFLVYLPYGWMQTIAFYIMGVSLLSVAIVLQYKTLIKLNLGAIVLALMGFGFFLIATFPMKYPGTVETLTSKIHSVATIAVTIIFPLACFLVAPILKSLNLRYLQIYTIAAGIFQLLFILFGNYFLVHELGITGIYERILLWNGQLWIVVICLTMLLLELRNHVPEKTWKQVCVQSSVYGLIYVYGTIVWPLCLPVIHTFLLA